MHFAVSQGATDSIHVLVMNGGDVNMRDNAGNSSIHICIKCEKYEVLDDLILFGGDVVCNIIEWS
jgi:ankyrin repeat protein